MINNIVTGFVTVAVLGLGAVVLTRSDVSPRLGALAGPEVLSYLNVHGQFTSGRGCTATSSTATAGTLQGSEVVDTNCIDVTPNTSDFTLTLAASTTAMCPSDPGQTRRWTIRNATTTAATDVIIAGGTGIYLKRASSTAGTLIQGDTDAKNVAVLDVVRLSNTDCVAAMTLFND